MRPEDELRELAADLHALLLAEHGRGLRDEPLDAALPEAIAWEDGSEVVATADVASLPKREAGAAGAAWSAMAREARAVHDAPVTLERVREELGDCRRCPLCESRRSLVFGDGSPTADLFIIGEGPDAAEDAEGRPFAGQSGEMLDKMLMGVLGLGRDEVYVSNIVKCRPPQRDPHPPERAACLPFLVRQIEVVQPKIILVVGRVAMQTLFDTRDGVKFSRGQWKNWRGYDTMVTFHPATLLRSPSDKRWTFEDLKAVARRYRELGGQRSRPSPF